MKTNVQNATKLDSKCGRRLPASDAPHTTGPRCKVDATTWVVSPKGTRRYLCEDHAREVLRFREDEGTPALPDHPTVRPCSVCGKYTLRGDIDLSTGTCDHCLPAEDDERTAVEVGGTTGG